MERFYRDHKENESMEAFFERTKIDKTDLFPYKYYGSPEG
jgi:hypothetical protein